MTEVKVPCLCEGEPHPDGDTVWFRERIDFRTLSLARQEISLLKAEQQGEASIPGILALLSEFYLLHCIERWTLVDAKGKALPPSMANIRERILENDPVRAQELAEFADGLYSAKVIVPLVMAASRSSLTMPTNGSTSATSGTGKSRKRSKRSSTSTIPTAATAKTPK